MSENKKLKTMVMFWTEDENVSINFSNDGNYVISRIVR